MTTQPIGQLKSSKTVYRTVCSQSLKRNAFVLVN